MSALFLNLADDLWPVGVEHLALWFVEALVGVGTEEVALGLQEVGREAGGAVAVVVAEAGAERWDGDAVEGGECDDFTPVLLGFGQQVLEEGGEHEVAQLGVLAVSVGDAVEEAGADDATATPDGGDAAEVEAPIFLLAHGFDEVETLRIGDDLGGVECVVHFLDQFGFVGGDVDSRTGEFGAGGDAGFLFGGKDAGLDRCVDGGDHDGVFCRIQQGPLTGAFLACFIDDEFDDRCAGLRIFLFQGFAGDLDQVALHGTFVPLIEDGGHFVGGETGVFEEVVGLADELHVAVFDAVVDHLHVMTSAAGADVDDARLAIDFGCDGFEDGLHDFPGGSRTAGHDGGAFAGTFFAAGDPCADEAQAFLSEVGVAPLGGLVETVAAVDDDIVLVEQGDELLNHGVHRIAVAILHRGGFHHDVNFAWGGEGLDKVLQGLSADEGFARVFGEEFVGDAGGAVIDADLKATAFDIQHEVLPHYGEANQSKVTLFAHFCRYSVFYPGGRGAVLGCGEGVLALVSQMATGFLGGVDWLDKIDGRTSEKRVGGGTRAR